MGSFDSDLLEHELGNCLACLGELLELTAGQVGEVESLAADAGIPLQDGIKHLGRIYSWPFEGVEIAEYTSDAEVAHRSFALAHTAALAHLWRVLANRERAVAEALEGWTEPEEER